MTCIVGLEYKGKVYIGGDSAGVSGLSIRIRSDTKVFKRGPFIMGFTSSFRMGQLLMYKLNVSKQTRNQTDYQYMVTTFIDAVRECLKNGGFAARSEEVESGGTFLVGYKNKLYKICEDYQVGVPAASYSSIGCGNKFAIGAIRVLMQQKNITPKKAIQEALETAVAFSGGVRPPFTIMGGSGKRI